MAAPRGRAAPGRGRSRRLAQARYLDGGAPVHDHVETGRAGALVRRLVDDVQLEPDRLRALRDRFVGDRPARSLLTKTSTTSTSKGMSASEA
jgi:hypothetical protein